MALGKDGTLLRDLGALFQAGTFGDLTDGQLLERFASARGEVAEHAFAALVERHGSMVLRVCRSVLPDLNDAEDAFQATFLVLVHKARGLWVLDSLGPWLHQVAYRTSKCARVSAARRKRIEETITTPGQAAESDHRIQWLHEEIERLPERYRAPVVLCDLEGRTHEQAARHLGWPIGTVKSRQSRGRERLRDRLVRRGSASSVGMLFGGMKSIVSPSLIESTTRNAVIASTTRSFLSGSAAILTQEVLGTMTLARWWKVATLLLALGATVSGAAVFAQKEKREADDPAAPVFVKDEQLTFPVKRGKFKSVISERGNLEAANSSSILNEVEGITTIISILPEGKMVKANDLICELDSSIWRDKFENQQVATRKAQSDFETAELARQAAEGRIKEYADGILSQEMMALNLEIAKASFDKVRAHGQKGRARVALEKLKELEKGKGSLTPADILARLDVEDRLEQADIAMGLAQQTENLVQKKMEILTQFTKPRILQELNTELQAKKAEEFARKNTWSLEKSKENKLKKIIGKCKLYAPSDGILVYANLRANPANQTMIEEGATVRERQRLFDVVDIHGPMKVNTKVHESIVDRLETGQVARILVDALPNMEFKGTVKTIAPLPDPSLPGQNRTWKAYTTFVELRDGSPMLRPGMTAKVEITTADRDNVLSVPVQAIRQIEGKDLVRLKLPDGTFEWREVELGMTNGQEVEVKSGLKEGDIVDGFLSSSTRKARPKGVADPVSKEK